MRIKINETNKDKIANLIQQAEKHCTVRKISIENVFDEIKTAVKNFQWHCIPKKYWHLIKLQIDFNAQKFASAYEYTPYSTVFSVEFNRTGQPLLTALARNECDNKKIRWYPATKDCSEQLKEVLFNSFSF